MRDKIILNRRENPNIVALPNGRTFTSKWERISRKQLPINIRVTKTRKIVPRRNNRRILLNLAAPAFKKIKAKRKRLKTGKGIAENLAKTGFELGSRALGTKIGQKLINRGIDNIPNIFSFAASKIKNKNGPKALQSELRIW